MESLLRMKRLFGGSHGVPVLSQEFFDFENGELILNSSRDYSYTPPEGLLEQLATDLFTHLRERTQNPTWREKFDAFASDYNKYSEKEEKRAEETSEITLGQAAREMDHHLRFRTRDKEHPEIVEFVEEANYLREVWEAYASDLLRASIAGVEDPIAAVMADPPKIAHFSPHKIPSFQMLENLMILLDFNTMSLEKVLNAVEESDLYLEEMGQEPYFGSTAIQEVKDSAIPHLYSRFSLDDTTKKLQEQAAELLVEGRYLTEEEREIVHESSVVTIYDTTHDGIHYLLEATVVKDSSKLTEDNILWRATLTLESLPEESPESAKIRALQETAVALRKFVYTPMLPISGDDVVYTGRIYGSSLQTLEKRHDAKLTVDVVNGQLNVTYGFFEQLYPETPPTSGELKSGFKELIIPINALASALRELQP